MFRFYKIFIIILLGLSSCASDPKITVDPKSVKDMGKYQTDLKECKDIAMNLKTKMLKQRVQLLELELLLLQLPQ